MIDKITNTIKGFFGGNKEDVLTGGLQEDLVVDYVNSANKKAEEKELVQLAKDWEKKWYSSDEFSKMRDIWEMNYKYWKGEHDSNYQNYLGDLWGYSKQLIDNRLFAALETILPIVGKQVPEPVVEPNVKHPLSFDYEFADNVKDSIYSQSKLSHLRFRGKKALRNWAVYHLGIAKVYYDKNIGSQIYCVNPSNMIFDANGYIDEAGDYKGSYIGERKLFTAEKLVKMFPEKSETIKKLVDGKMGSSVYISEYWYDDFIFWKFKDVILGVQNYPYWRRGVNHFSKKEFPYIFITIFNLGRSYFDDTGLMQQNIPLQDLINKRLRQIDKNVDKLNTALAISGDSGLTKAQAKELVRSYEQGKGVYIQRGKPGEVLDVLQVPPIPQSAYQQLLDIRAEMDNIFGTHATTRGESQKYVTATGILASRQGDEKRASLISDSLENFYEKIFNWFVQFDYVYNPERLAAKGAFNIAKGRGEKNELLTTPVLVSVKENSLIPKDEITTRNTILTLLQMDKIDLLSAYEALELPDPQKFYKRYIQYKTNPTALVESSPKQQENQIVTSPETLPQASVPEQPQPEVSAPPPSQEKRLTLEDIIQ